jgi:Fe-S-cluster containining protein
MQWEEDAKKAYKINKKFFDKLKKNPPRDLDRQFHDAHEIVFSKLDCLTCANCCKTISPIIKSKDVERLAAHFKIRPAQVVEKYLKIDSDGDYVFQKTPCPFLQSDNYCSVYDSRPNACRGYPHTDQVSMKSILPLTLRNTLSCPAVYEIVEELKTKNK